MIFKSRCKNHFFKKSISICEVCSNKFCESCLSEVNTHVLCSDHSNFFNAEHIEYVKASANPKNPEAGVKVLNLKELGWNKYKLESIIKSEYELIEDIPVTYSTLIVKKSDIDTWSQINDSK